jgi:hypothetical protein
MEMKTGVFPIQWLLVIIMLMESMVPVERVNLLLSVQGNVLPHQDVLMLVIRSMLFLHTQFLKTKKRL